MSAKSVHLNMVTKEFKDDQGKTSTAVSQVNLKVEPGEFVTLLGPSGCGKTTTLRMVAGFETITTGDIFFGADNVRDVSPSKRDCTMVFQSYALFPHMSVYENVAYGLRIKKMSDTDIRSKVNSIFDIMNLRDYSARMPAQLSGGQQQRVALARALVMEPGVLLFDEPLSNLDAKLRLTMRDEIRRIQQEVGITTLYVTHDQAEAMSMSDRIVVMNQGRIEQVGTPVEIYQQPATEFVAGFIGSANFLRGVVVEKKNTQHAVKYPMGILQQFFEDDQAINGEEIVTAIRPEAISLHIEAPINLNGHNIVNGMVKKSVFMGQTQEYTVEINGINLDVHASNPISERVFTVGQEVSVAIPYDAMRKVN
ncbi:ABC transporter ATP-binding protein [Salinispirillum marinum]|uniref:Spermidine/putrescine import ATP-binding protein PotA n=2 Tax=Saccharospirillaceae TaxID=255527 RepID=A0ABV8BDM4_9GAMM